MLTAFDVAVGVLVLISAILATARGFTREILSLATWAGSAAIALYMYLNHNDIARQYIAEELVADIATVVVTFIVALVILHLITMRIADFVVDSRIGPIDRTLGFIFGVARGLLIAIVVVIFGVWLFPGELPAWAAEAQSLPHLRSMGDQLIGLLPENLEQQLTEILQGGRSLTDDELPLPNETTPVPPATTPTQTPAPGNEVAI